MSAEEFAPAFAESASSRQGIQPERVKLSMFSKPLVFTIGHRDRIGDHGPLYFKVVLLRRSRWQHNVGHAHENPSCPWP